MYFLQNILLELNPLILFAALLLTGLIGGEIAKRSKFVPQIVGYTIVGFLLSISIFSSINQEILEKARILIQISLGLILFDLGRYLDFRWLRNDIGLLFSSFSEALLTFIFVFIILKFFNFPTLPALLAATFAIATSPAVVMLIARDLNAEGPVTRRTLILTSLNNFYSLVIFSLLFPVTISLEQVNSFDIILHSFYRLLGSAILGFIIFMMVKYIAFLTQKIQIKQFILITGAVVLTIGLANLFHLSTMLSLFVLGVAVRNFDTTHVLVEVDLTWLARPFLIILFVISGFYLQFQSVWVIGIVVFTFILVRIFAKFLGIYLFAKKSRLSRSQIFAIGLALTPMGGATIGMYSALETFSPEFTHQLTIIITAVLTLLNLLGPIATQVAFIKSKETAENIE